MTKRLDKAIGKVRKLLPARQDAVAASILEQVGGPPVRARRAGQAESRLDALVREADRQIDGGETMPLDVLPRR